MKSLRVSTIVGARPQFIKAAAVARATSAHNEDESSVLIAETLIHTGQHYDYELSELFFRELGLPEPSYHLAVGSGSHGRQTGEMLTRLEPVLIQEAPDVVVVYGDTNSTLAGALTAAKLKLPLAHVEAGLRSGRSDMPEEVNRVVTDRLSTLLFCPSDRSVENLHMEGIREGVMLVGDVMHDVLLFHLSRAEMHLGLLHDLKVAPGAFVVVTIYRAENTDDEHRLQAIFDGLEKVASRGTPVIIPLHPRTLAALGGRRFDDPVRILKPLSYGQMLCLMQHARVVVTDSGGIQKEAYWMGVPCATLRRETEWVETVDAGWNMLVDADPELITRAVSHPPGHASRPPLYGEGNVSARVVRELIARFAGGRDRTT